MKTAKQILRNNFLKMKQPASLEQNYCLSELDMFESSMKEYTAQFIDLAANEVDNISGGDYFVETILNIKKQIK